MTFNYIGVPSALNTLLPRLELCQSNEEYVVILNQLYEEAKSDPNVKAAYTNLLSKHPNLLNVDSKTVAKVLHEFYFPKSSPISSKLTLDFDTTQNIRRELSRTFQDFNLDYLANST